MIISMERELPDWQMGTYAESTAVMVRSSSQVDYQANNNQAGDEQNYRTWVCLEIKVGKNA